MTTQILDAPAVVSLLPKEQHRRVPADVIAHGLAFVLDQTRHTDVSIERAVSTFLETYSIALPNGITASRLTDDIMQRIFADDVYDNEFYQALRATRTTLSEVFASDSIRAAGWLRRFEVFSGWQRHRLTGQACPRCEINPECYSSGGGTHCLDIAGCGWSLCF